MSPEGSFLPTVTLRKSRVDAGLASNPRISSSSRIYSGFCVALSVQKVREVIVEDRPPEQGLSEERSQAAGPSEPQSPPLFSEDREVPVL